MFGSELLTSALQQDVKQVVHLLTVDAVLLQTEGGGVRKHLHLQPQNHWLPTADMHYNPFLAFWLVSWWLKMIARSSRAANQVYDKCIM